MTSASDYDADVEHVGYGKPPRRTQFRKGRSGNPRGRPKGAGVRSAMEKVAARTIAMTVEGKRRQVPVTEALLMQLLQGALAGDAPARRDFLKIADQVSQARTEDEKTKPVQVIIEAFTFSDKCHQALLMLGAVCEVGDDKTLKVLPWVVEAAKAQGKNLCGAVLNMVAEVTVKPDDVLRPKYNR